MRIRDVAFTFLRHAIAKKYGDAQGLKTQRATLLIRIDTDDGPCGWGDTSTRGDFNVAHLRETREMLCGQNPLAAAPLVHKLGIFGTRIAAGIDVALADLRGRAAGMNVATLLGGAFRTRQPCYASLQNANENEDIDADAVAQATHAVSLGFRHVKMKVGWHSPDVDARWVNAVLAALPEDVLLAIDANRVLDIASAERLAQGIEDLDRISWFEEPLSNRYPRAYAELRTRVPVPIAGGESMTVAMLNDVIAGRMMDIVQPDLIGHGGFAAMRTLLDLCDIHGVRLIPHCFDGQIMRLATLHLLASRPDWEEKHGEYDSPPVEVDISPNPVRDELLTENLRPDADGYLAVPAGAGLAIAVNEDFVAKAGQPIAL
ncbi:MAG TPA: mandelate racemase/muconate lactonizing enzyme family protein [Acetobacteraceae bacterium]|jgi:D-galactarolactone cycloisomerase|nr:mandelate racemase/muconate lactonizing enzyme family protein [Acetobacteraceae bacterium]